MENMRGEEKEREEVPASSDGKGHMFVINVVVRWEGAHSNVALIECKFFY